MTDDSKNGNPPKREMHDEIAALVGAIAKAFGIPEADAIGALEQNAISMEFGQDANGNRFVNATYEGKTARLYQGAIKREDGTGD